MKFTVSVTGEAALGLPEQDFELESASGDEAVNVARAKLETLVPLEGGALDIVVSAAEPYEIVSKSPRGGEIRETVPAGVVSSFSVRFEPHESVRRQAAARQLDLGLAKLEGAERTAQRAAHLIDLATTGVLTLEHARAALKTEQSLEFVVNEAVAAEKGVAT